ncbi:MAG: competence type IV pilus minor pilin ComGD [Erysipelotrichaceae bacterium]
MGKQVLNKGFTMIEMILVLSIISIMMLIVPNLLRYEIPLSFQMQYLKEQLLTNQIKAMMNKKRIFLAIHHDSITINEQEYKFQGNMICEPTTIAFNGFGNVNKAQSIHCYQGESTMRIVVQLGSGRTDVRK